jgi:enoyl-CoA hydratase/carnithine racemase
MPPYLVVAREQCLFSTHTTCKGASCQSPPKSTARVSVLTFRWTDKRNALNPDDAQAIVAAIEQASATASLLIVTGEGAFCSGGDLPAFAALSAGAKDIA